MEAKDIYAKLAELAPSVAFSASREIDENFRWDGDGPDPIDEGYDPCDVTIKASAIIGGKLVSGNEYLGGSYFKEDESMDDNDIGGYLPQMLREAAVALEERVDDPTIESQLKAVQAFLTQEMKDRWQAQQDERAAKA